MQASCSSLTPPAVPVAQDNEQPQCRPFTPSRPSTPAQEEPCGLTQASLKHLRRRCDGLCEDKEKLLAEIQRLEALLREQRDRFAGMEANAKAPRKEVAAPVLVTSTKDESEARAAREVDLQARLARLEEERDLLDKTLSRRESEIERLRRELEERLHMEKDQREAAERTSELEAQSSSRTAELMERVQVLEKQLGQLQSQNGDLEGQVGDLAHRAAKSQKEASESAARAESVTKMHEDFKQKTEQLRTGIVGTAIQSKLELHISVPHVVLTYNNAPPLRVSTAIGLSKGKIGNFLDTMLFPYFDPLWVCLDGLDVAPDGTNKKRYSARMLERLTDSIKDFIEKSQAGDAAELGGLDSTETCAEARRPRSRDEVGFKGLGSLRSKSGSR